MLFEKTGGKCYFSHSSANLTQKYLYLQKNMLRLLSFLFHHAKNLLISAFFCNFATIMIQSLIYILMKRIFFFLAFLISFTMSFAQTARKFVLPNSTDGQSEITVYLPENPSGRAVVCCPGGGYTHLAMDHEGHDWAPFFNSRGIALAVLKYRMPNGDRNIPMSDAFQAIQTLRDSADVWNLNPYDIGIMGSSAGGHLASTVSTHADAAVRPNFTILFYPVVSMNERDSHKGSCVGFLGEQRSDKNLVREFSNFNAVRRHLTPPCIIMLSSDDGVVPPPTNGVAYYNAMVNQGNYCALYTYPSGGHGWGSRPSFKYHQLMESELSTWLENLPSPKKDAIRVACIGNSITDGSGIYASDTHGYPARLQQKLGANYNVKNFGVGARTLLNKGDHPYMNELAWRDALAFNPNIVIIKLGTNDSKTDNWVHKDEFRQDYQQMIDALRALPSKPTIYLCTPIPAFKTQWTITDSVITNEVIPAIQKVAKKNKLQVIDLHTLFKNDDKKQIQSDGIHPNDAGANQMANIIFDFLKAK